jgi:hypothetical protein
VTVTLRVVNRRLEWLVVEPTGYHIGVNCPRCGAATVLVATGSKRSWQQAGAIECSTSCRWKGFVNVELSTANAETVNLELVQHSIRSEREAAHTEAVQRTQTTLFNLIDA